MAKNLVIVESPAKAKTINKYLGKDYLVKASIGHIKDLPSKGLGVDIEHNFEPTYELIPDSKKRNNKRIVAELKKAAKEAEAIYLAADPDREGEAICQHLAEEIVPKRPRKPSYRVMFNEITKRAVQDAFKEPREIDPNLVDAQQARRVLDRLVGYKVSPLLCRTIGGRLSAGRVQSVALRMVVEREREIEKFVKTEYWTVGANLSAKLPPAFDARLLKVGEQTVKTSGFDQEIKKSEILIGDESSARAIVEEAERQQFVASQMNPAVFDQTTIDIEAGRFLFRATGSVLKFDGFLKVYEEGRDEKVEEDEEAARKLPLVEAGENLKLNAVSPEQHFTEPPPRYTEATLVKALEEKGIGRPSTYAAIMTTIQDREYVERVDSRFHPTALGMTVNDLLVEGGFDDLFNESYTARMEEELDDIEEGKLAWTAAIGEFYEKFARDLKAFETYVKGRKQQAIPTDEKCENCGSPMVIKLGRFGQFMACSNYPECRTTREVSKPAGDGDGAAAGASRGGADG